MQIGGLQKFSLIDYPDHISAVIFTQGCNFRCPYCHNPELVLPDRFRKTLDPEHILTYLDSRKGKIDGVTITGGEPTLQQDLLIYLSKIKERSFKIKLDTNGAKPEVIKNALESNLLDFIAMDIKAPLESYSVLAGVQVDTDAIEKSIAVILDSGIAYQFRTTFVPQLLSNRMLEEIKSWMRSLNANYIVQDFVFSTVLDPTIIAPE